MYLKYGKLLVRPNIKYNMFPRQRPSRLHCRDLRILNEYFETIFVLREQRRKDVQR